MPPPLPYNQGRIQHFKLGGVHLRKLRRAEGGAKMFGVFRVKNQDFTPKNLIFFPIAEGGAKIFGVFWIRPWLLQHKVTVHLC